ncbi:helix-turn-helix transcriptional regulator [uncultured Ilyobacter sp.]|uniref:helix-turn-helix domain-containing protein n=1 Tax=uncultured Ilyobacter sp. TaxID=544433 RepID=UPI0029C036EC|nr:helix-turn-helix transcriptional regulator [uncultured Ilyobacter sp.]
MKNVGKNLKETRSKLGYTQEKIEKLTGISRSLISMYENGEREISLSNLNKLANFFGKSINYFLGVSTEEKELKISYRATELTERDAENLKRAKKFINNLHELQEM